MYMVFSRAALSRVVPAKHIPWCEGLFEKLASVGISCSVPDGSWERPDKENPGLYVSVSVDEGGPFFLRIRFDVFGGSDHFCYGMGRFENRELSFELRWREFGNAKEEYESITFNLRKFVEADQPAGGSSLSTSSSSSLQRILFSSDALQRSGAVPDKVIPWCLGLFETLSSVGISCSVPDNGWQRPKSGQPALYVSVSLGGGSPCYLRLRFVNMHGDDYFCYCMGKFGNSESPPDTRWSDFADSEEKYQSIASNLKTFLLSTPHLTPPSLDAQPDSRYGGNGAAHRSAAGHRHPSEGWGGQQAMEKNPGPFLDEEQDLDAKVEGLYSIKDLSEIVSDSDGVQWCVTLFRFLREAGLRCNVPGPSWISSWPAKDLVRTVFVLVSEYQGDGPGIYLRLRFDTYAVGLVVLPGVGTLRRDDRLELGLVQIGSRNQNEQEQDAHNVVSNVHRFLKPSRDELAVITSAPPTVTETARRIEQLLDHLPRDTPSETLAALRREFDALVQLARASSST
jgi:hypothetical protein